VVFAAPIKGAKQTRVAGEVGMSQASASLHSLRAEGPDRPGVGAKACRALSDAGINMRGFSAASLGRRAVIYFAFDTAEDAAKAGRVLTKALG
jgi:hypothetical protein